MNTKYSEWFRVFYNQVTYVLKYYFDVTDTEQMKHAKELYNLGMSAEDAARAISNTTRTN